MNWPSTNKAPRKLSSPKTSRSAISNKDLRARRHCNCPSQILDHNIQHPLGLHQFHPIRTGDEYRKRRYRYKGKQGRYRSCSSEGQSQQPFQPMIQEMHTSLQRKIPESLEQETRTHELAPTPQAPFVLRNLMPMSMKTVPAQAQPFGRQMRPSLARAARVVKVLSSGGIVDST
jgi:hypothetical protein